MELTVSESTMVKIVQIGFVGSESESKLPSGPSLLTGHGVEDASSGSPVATGCPTMAPPLGGGGMYACWANVGEGKQGAQGGP